MPEVPANRRRKASGGKTFSAMPEATSAPQLPTPQFDAQSDSNGNPPMPKPVRAPTVQTPGESSTPGMPEPTRAPSMPEPARTPPMPTPERSRTTPSRPHQIRSTTLAHMPGNFSTESEQSSTQGQDKELDLEERNDSPTGGSPPMPQPTYSQADPPIGFPEPQDSEGSDFFTKHSSHQNPDRAQYPTPFAPIGLSSHAKSGAPVGLGATPFAPLGLPVPHGSVESYYSPTEDWLEEGYPMPTAITTDDYAEVKDHDADDHKPPPFPSAPNAPPNFRPRPQQQHSGSEASFQGKAPPFPSSGLASHGSDMAQPAHTTQHGQQNPAGQPWLPNHAKPQAPSTASSKPPPSSTTTYNTNSSQGQHGDGPAKPTPHTHIPLKPASPLQAQQHSAKPPSSQFGGSQQHNKPSFQAGKPETQPIRPQSNSPPSVYSQTSHHTTSTSPPSFPKPPQSNYGSSTSHAPSAQKPPSSTYNAPSIKPSIAASTAPSGKPTTASYNAPPIKPSISTTSSNSVTTKPPNASYTAPALNQSASIASVSAPPPRLEHKPSGNSDSGNGGGIGGSQIDGSGSGHNHTRYVNMLLALDDIPNWFNLLASFFTWILLAGFLLFPGTFTSLRQVAQDATNINDLQRQILNAVTNVPLFVIAWICSGIGASGMIWLWWRWRANYIWLLSKIFVPGFLNGLAGVITTLVNVYGAQDGQFSTTAKVTIIVVSSTAGACGLLLLFYQLWLLRRVRAEHDRIVGEQAAGKHGEGILRSMMTSKNSEKKARQRKPGKGGA